VPPVRRATELPRPIRLVHAAADSAWLKPGSEPGRGSARLTRERADIRAEDADGVAELA
jgi:hypothetical protein